MAISKENRIAYISTPETITIVLDGQHRTIQIKSKHHRNEVVSALERFKKSPQTTFDKDALEVYLAPIKRAVLASDNRFELSANGKVLYLVGSKVPIPSQLGNHIMDFLENKLPVDALVKFWESCLKNPHYVAIQELFNFLDENRLPITEDGGFLGYKKLNFVRGANRIDVPDEFEELTINEAGKVVSITGGIVIPSVAKKYLAFAGLTSSPTMVDVHSGTIHQKIGETVKIERIKLNEEARRSECGYGLHIGAFGYSFSGDVRVLCKVFPADVIACNEGQAKLRTCSYQIVSFVDSGKEVKEMFCNLSGASKAVADGEFGEDEDLDVFEVQDEVICIDAEDCDAQLNEDDVYTILDTRDGEVLVITNDGEPEWFSSDRFVNAEE